MIAIRTLLLSLVLLAGGILPAGAAELSLSDKVGLQAAMQRHIDSQSVDGALLYLEPESGDVLPLHPVTAHPMILAMGPHFVMCFDFRDDAGSKVPVDFYMARNATGYAVFHTAVGDRTLLKRLMSDGRIVRVR